MSPEPVSARLPMNCPPLAPRLLSGSSTRRGQHRRATAEHKRNRTNHECELRGATAGRRTGAAAARIHRREQTRLASVVHGGNDPHLNVTMRFCWLPIQATLYPVLRVVLRADGGTRTRDLLHGKQTL